MRRLPTCATGGGEVAGRARFPQSLLRSERGLWSEPVGSDHKPTPLVVLGPSHCARNGGFSGELPEQRNGSSGGRTPEETADCARNHRHGTPDGPAFGWAVCQVRVSSVHLRTFIRRVRDA
jgi:hypothetical protein